MEGVGARSVNKHRQTLAAIFNFGLRPDQEERWGLTRNRADMAAKRREDPPARMEVFTVEQVSCSRRPPTRPTRSWGRWCGWRPTRVSAEVSSSR